MKVRNWWDGPPPIVCLVALCILLTEGMPLDAGFQITSANSASKNSNYRIILYLAQEEARCLQDYVSSFILVIESFVLKSKERMKGKTALSATLSLLSSNKLQIFCEMWVDKRSFDLLLLSILIELN
jgi:hypothetical protein